MIFRSKTVYPEVIIGTYLYDDGSDEFNYYEMADTLVHEGCHVKQAHDLRGFFMSKSARECHTAAIDALKKIGAPQELIDWDQDIIDRYTADDFCWRFITTVSNSEIIVCAYCKKPILAREAYVYHPTIERIYYLYSPPRESVKCVIGKTLSR